MDSTTNLQMPYIMPSQAQKHVTHNEAIRLLDALVQLAVATRSQAEPPEEPLDGSRYIPASGATGDWQAWDWNIAYRADGAWMKLVPRPGWIVWVEDEQAALVWHDGEWRPLGAGTGGDGSSWLTGSVDPDAGDGADGDLYLQTAAGDEGLPGDVWLRADGEWSVIVSLRGADGDGSGDVAGPDGGVTGGEAAVFQGGSGKTIAGAGGPPALASDLLATHAVLRGDGARGIRPSGVAIDDDDCITGHANMGWQQADLTGGEIAFDCAGGAALSWHVTAAGAAEMQAPTNLPDGWTCQIEIDPSGHAIGWSAAYREPTPDIAARTIVAILRRGSAFVAVAVHEED